MQIDLRLSLSQLDIDFIVMENGVLGTTIESRKDDSQAFPMAIYQWTAGNEKDYIRLMITPFIERPEEGYSFDLTYKVLTINHQIPMAKFIFDEDEDLALVLDIDVEEWDQNKLVKALDILGPYADYYFSELESL